MTTEIAIVPQNYTELERLATTASGTGFYGVKNKEQAMILLMRGRDLGLSYTQALDAFHIINGKPAMKADGMVAVCVAKPALCKYFRTVESTSEKCTVETLRAGEPSARSLTFTMADAKMAGLTGGNWAKYPAAMLRARAKSALARDTYPDLLMGILSTEEAEDIAIEMRPGPKTTVVDAEIVDAEHTNAPASTGDKPAHHPSWTQKESRAFCAGLRDLAGGPIEYDVLAAYAQVTEPWNARPSMMDTPTRKALYASINNGGRAAFEAWRAEQEAPPVEDGALAREGEQA